MSRKQYDEAVAKAIRTYPPGAHEGWVADMQTFEAKVPGLIHHRRERMTGDPTALIEARYRLASDGPAGPEVARELIRVWVEDMVVKEWVRDETSKRRVARPEPEWHITSVEPGEVVLEAFTVHAGRYISVRVIVDISRTAAA